MKKTLLSIICFLTYALAIQAQTLYGTTYTGGSIYGAGTIIKFIPPGNYTVLNNFGSTTARNPSGALVQASNGKLYGATQNGGSNEYGTIYSFDTLTSAVALLHNFDSQTGTPNGSLIQASNGKLYGMTVNGVTNSGSIFSFDPATSTYTKLFDINGDNGGSPFGASLIQASDGKLYGMTTRGGTGDGGVIFSFDPSSLTYMKLYSFIRSISGDEPFGKLVQASNGKLYGMTTAFDSLSFGTIFSFDPITFEFLKLKNFSDADGQNGLGSLTKASNGKLYGMTNIGGSSNAGVIFSFDPLTSTYTKLKDFNGADGSFPFGNLIQASDGKLYGATNGGGSNNLGVVFSFDPSTSTYTKLIDYTLQPDGTGYGNTYGDGFIELATCISKTYYRDADGDGYGNINDKLKACSQPTGYVSNSNDCNDNDKGVHSAIKYYRDADRDGYGDNLVFTNACTSIPPAGYVKNNYDCDDHQKSANTCKVRVKMCHNGRTECVSATDINKKLRHGWTLGQCPPSCGHISSRTAIGGPGNIELSYTDQSMPREYKLSNYPNPFAGTSTIQYELPFDSKVSIKVYDLLGRAVTTLVNEDKKAGIYTVAFNADRFSKGSFYYRIIAQSKDGQFEQTNKMIQLK